MANLPITTAVPKDPAKINGAYYSYDLSFIASCLQSDSSIQIIACTQHPFRLETKLFHLVPEQKVAQFFREYEAGLIRAEPKSMAYMIHELKRMPLSSPKSATPITDKKGNTNQTF